MAYSCQFSVVIPAYNGADTLAETIGSLQRQTLPDWQAIVVDDGSTDSTVEVARQLAQADDRLLIILQPNQGVSAARNTGARLAQAEWLLFLDADDWIAPDYLERMQAKIATDAALDAVHCGWVRVAPDGTRVGEKHPPQGADLFPDLARYCPFAMHSCMVRRSVFLEVGGFDPSLVTCEDWDLWQRVARQGGRFGGIPEVLAFYRMRPRSLSGNGKQFFGDGLRVFNQGYAPDPRVAYPVPAYAQGLVVDDLELRRFQWAVWPAGLVLGAGVDASPLLELLTGSAPGLPPFRVAESLFESIILPTASTPETAWHLWETVATPIHQFLTALETASQATYLARCTSLILERMIMHHAQAPLPIQVGSFYGVSVEVTRPIADLYPPAGVDHLFGHVTLAGKPLGTLELPVCDGWVAGAVLRDSIAAQYTWTILGHFFTATVYPAQLAEAQQVTGEEPDSLPDHGGAYHDRQGWVTFLRELWGCPHWPDAAFYDPNYAPNYTENGDQEVEPTEPGAKPCTQQTVTVADDRITLEVSQPLPNLVNLGEAVAVTLTVGGVALGVISVPAIDGYLSAQALQVALTLETGFELCRVAVREALVGRALADGSSLRQRLADKAQPSPPRLTQLAPDSIDLSRWLILGQRFAPLGSSSSRYAVLPAAAAPVLKAMATTVQEPILQAPDSGPALRVAYAPDAIVALFPPTSSPSNSTVETSTTSTISADVPTHFNNRNHFETIFATQPDPWKYTTAYEQTKYEQTLDLLPDQPIAQALELACAEGHFTAQLAPRVQSLLATDVSQIAVDRAAQRCTAFPHVQFQQLDMAKDPLPASLDLIVCSEVLYYIGGWDILKAFAHKVTEALAPGGYFLTAHAHLVVDEPDRPGYDWDHPFGAKGISDVFSAVEGLRLVKELRTPLYRIQLFQKSKPTLLGLLEQGRSPTLVELPQPTPPPERVAHTVLWQGGQPNPQPLVPITTDRLPILMYHRIAPAGNPRLNQWRLTPDAFAAQLGYLRDAGYYSINLETWRQAIATKQPLPGRAILLTFDDGYLDFFTHAFPLLQNYGFSATVFLVADRVGQTNAWDAFYGEEVPLMTWEQIRQLQTQGIEFGSHSATHRPLTGLSLAEIVEEGARSRTLLTQALGRPIQTIAYPYGDMDSTVDHLMAACGYTAGVTCRTASSRFNDSPLALPRLEIMGNDSLETFIAKLSW